MSSFTLDKYVCGFLSNYPKDQWQHVLSSLLHISIQYVIRQYPQLPTIHEINNIIRTGSKDDQLMGELQNIQHKLHKIDKKLRKVTKGIKNTDKLFDNDESSQLKKSSEKLRSNSVCQNKLKRDFISSSEHPSRVADISIELLLPQDLKNSQIPNSEHNKSVQSNSQKSVKNRVF